MAINNIDSFSQGELVQILFSNGVRSQLSTAYPDFKYVDSFKESNSMARELRFMFQDGYGPAAVQYGNPGSRGAFPAAQQSSINEYTAKLKKLNATIDVDYDVYDRARKSPERYMLPLALELSSKNTAAKRRIAADFHGDGTGVVGEVSSAASYNGSANTQVITLKSGADDFGHVGMCEYGDLLIATQADGSARDPAGTTTNFYAWKITDRDRENNTITVQPVTSAGATDTDISGTQWASGDVLYRVGDPILSAVGGTSVTSSNDLSGSLTDYGTDGYAITGLDSLVRAERTVHGISLTGANKPTEKLLTNNEQISSRYIQQLLSQTKTAVGADAYSWKMITMSPETLDTLIDANEGDRRFVAKEDPERGAITWRYQHGTDSLEANPSEYCKPRVAYVMPESKDGKKVFEFWSTDFEPVRGEDMGTYHLDINSSGSYQNGMVSFLQCYGQIICNHAAAVGRLAGFTNQ